MPAPRLLLAAAAVLAAAGATAVAVTDVGPDGAAPPAAPPRCPEQYLPAVRQGAAPQPTLAAPPADATAVVVCAQTGAGVLRPEPLAATDRPDEVRRLVRALTGRVPARAPSSRSGCGSAAVRILVFLHPRGEHAYVVRLAPEAACSRISDGLTAGAVPPDLAAFALAP